MKSDWIEWHGEECPVSKDTIVQCKLRWDVGWNMETRPAREWSWNCDGDDSDIVAYRIVKE